VRRRTEAFASVLMVLALLALFPSLLSLAPLSSGIYAVDSTPPIGVYWDAVCTKKVYTLNWGILTPGEIRAITVYVRNEGNETIALRLTPTNWNPSSLAQQLIFSWSSLERKVNPGRTAKVTQTLRINSPYNAGNISFSFDILFEGMDHLVGDVNRDGSVNMRDVGVVCAAYGTRNGNPRWNQAADLDSDGVITMRDIEILLVDYGKDWAYNNIQS